MTHNCHICNALTSARCDDCGEPVCPDCSVLDIYCVECAARAEQAGLLPACVLVGFAVACGLVWLAWRLMT